MEKKSPITSSSVSYDFFPWNDAFKVNVPLIDEQHKKLVEILNNLCSGIFREITLIELEAAFKELLDYTVYHFESEEKIWRSHFKSKKEFLKHKEAHKDFIEKLHTRKRNLESEPITEVLAELIKYLVNWLAFHILETDMKDSKIILEMDKGADFNTAEEIAIEHSRKSKTLVTTIMGMYNRLTSKTIELILENKEDRVYLVNLAEQLTEAQNLGKIGSWELDLHSEYLFWTDEVYTITELAKDDFNATFQDYLEKRVHPDDKELLLDTYNKSVIDKETYSLKHRLLLPDNQIKVVHERGKTFYAEDGTPLRSIGTIQDITLITEKDEKVKRTLKQIIFVLSAALETRDPYTAGHEQNVAKIATAIANKLGLNLNIVEGIELAATIHDIGKIAMPSEILNKPGKLSPAEFELIKMHPEAGAKLLEGIEFDWPIFDTVLQHHERLDGSGYPKGLKGDEIIIEARILAVADTIEAMSSHRPYRAALGIDKALEEIKTNAGILYDPEVVKICVELYNSGELTV